MTAHDEKQFQKLKAADPTTADKMMIALRNLGSLKEVGRTVYYKIQDLMLGDILAPNAKLRNRHAGERCVIMLTGPAVNDLDIKHLASELTICCNLSYMHPDFAAMQPKYFALVEPFYGWLMGRKHIDEMTFLFRQVDAGLSAVKPHLLLNGSVRSLVRKHNFFAGKDISYVLPGERLLTARSLANDLTRRTEFAGGVVYAAIATAMYMGCREIYLIGAGYTYKPVYEHHFYDEVFLPDTLSEQQEQEELSRLRQQFPVVEISTASRNGRKKIVRITRRDDSFYDGYRIVRDFAASHGVRIVNVVPDGFSSPVFEKISSDTFAHDIVGSPSFGAAQ